MELGDHGWGTEGSSESQVPVLGQVQAIALRRWADASPDSQPCCRTTLTLALEPGLQPWDLPALSRPVHLTYAHPRVSSQNTSGMRPVCPARPKPLDLRPGSPTALTFPPSLHLPLSSTFVHSCQQEPLELEVRPWLTGVVLVPCTAHLACGHLAHHPQRRCGQPNSCHKGDSSKDRLTREVCLGGSA